MKIKKLINLRQAFKLLDNPEKIRKENIERKIRSLGRLQGSTKEELQDMSMYTH